MIKTRFAPSPTGFLHVGGLRAALFAYLAAKSQGGQFLLRIEDTDRERFIEGGIENIIRSLQWAGIEPDEGVALDKQGQIIHSGEAGPYIQSERLSIYAEYIRRLIKAGQAYYCFCAKARLEKLRKTQALNRLPTGYDGYCRALSAEEVKKKLAAGSESVVRLKVPKEGQTKFYDLIHGDVNFENKLIDDQVLIKADGFPTYHFAVVVDDHLMGITAVVRGEEWIPSTPKHIILYRAFDWEPPQYVHLPLLVNEQKQKLSKRHGDVSVENFKEAGYLPEAMINFVALLGWHPADDGRELFTLKELEQEFYIDRISLAPAVFNLKKLDWYNQQYIRRLEISELTKKCLPFLVNAGLISDSESIRGEQFDWLMGVVKLAHDRLIKLSELSVLVGFIFADELEYDASLLIWKTSTRLDAKEKLKALSKFLAKIEAGKWGEKGLEKKVKDWIEDCGYGTGDVLWPMRVALSGQKNSPGPFEIAGVLGKERTIGRLDLALSKLKD